METALVQPETEKEICCFHCGDPCPENHPEWNDKHFCCNGCEVVCQLLTSNGMEEFYSYDEKPGISKKNILRKSYDFLDDEAVVEKLITFREGNIAKIRFTLPQIHCSSCIWLLENIHKLNKGILFSRVQYLQKSASITFDISKINLKEVVLLLSSIGYDPELNFETLSGPKKDFANRSLYYKMGVAGFVFGNIMLLSFPEYLGFVQKDISQYIGLINIALSIPLVVYSGVDYLRSAFYSVVLKRITIDIPIATGILTLFFRSAYDILSGTGEGYLDSLAGFIFFMLIGKWFQNYTFQSIQFDRDYKSYFPISTWLKINGEYTTSTLEKIKEGDELLIKNEEIIPADGIITKGEAFLDYSFVTGESEVIHKKSGEKVFAGAKHSGASFEMSALHKVSQSYLTSLWEDHGYSPASKENQTKILDTIGRYFTIIVMSVAFLTLVYWLYDDPSKAYNSFTAVLIVACPCAISLAIPFTYGNILRLLAGQKCYLKNTETIENIQSVDHVVFDKTGTLTDHSKTSVTWMGEKLSTEQKQLIKSVAFQSNHPLSTSVFQSIEGPFETRLPSFEEEIGQGISGKINGHTIKIGSAHFCKIQDIDTAPKGVFITIDKQYLGYFKVENQIREGADSVIQYLSDSHPVTILSGDNENEKKKLSDMFPMVSDMIFHQTPKNKMDYIQNLQKDGKKVMMIGDGLNDAGALMQSNVGLVISANANNFTPACDGMIKADQFSNFTSILKTIKRSRYLVITAFIMAFMYNIIGLGFAVQGLLSPVIAAILMPVSSLTVMIFGLTSTHVLFRLFFAKSGIQHPSNDGEQ